MFNLFRVISRALSELRGIDWCVVDEWRCWKAILQGFALRHPCIRLFSQVR